MCVAVTQAYAARYFEEAKMTRKAAFYRVLAGNRFMKTGLKQNALGWSTYLGINSMKL